MTKHKMMFMKLEEFVFQALYDDVNDEEIVRGIECYLSDIKEILSEEKGG